MKEFVEKLIERLEEYQKVSTVKGIYGEYRAYSNAIGIVNQLAEEYNGGWIPYSTGEDLPWNGQKVWLSFTSPYTSFVKSAYWIYDHFEWANGKTVKDVPLAWKPYNVPAPYQPKGE